MPRMMHVPREIVMDPSSLSRQHRVKRCPECAYASGSTLLPGSATFSMG